MKLNRRLVIIGIVIFIGLLGLIGLILSYRPIRKTPERPEGRFKVSFEIAPADTLVQIDQETYKSPITLYLSPGNHTVRLERYGFKTKEYKYNIKKDDEFYIGMEPITQEARDWVKANPEIYLKQQGKGDADAMIEGQEMAKKYPLLTDLPKTGGSYQIGHKVDSSGNIVIVVHSPARFHSLAIKYLKDFRKDLSPYKFQFVDDLNPHHELNPFKLENRML